MTWILVKFTNLCMYKIFLFCPSLKEILFQCKLWHLRKGVKNYFMLFGFFDLFFELCLPLFSTFLIIAVFLKLSSSSIPRYANLCITTVLCFWCPPPSPLLCRDFQKALCSSVAAHHVSRSWLPRALLLPVCTVP